MVSFPKFTIKEMLEKGVHFGHKSMLWNPKMSPFIHGSKNGVHIIDLQRTASLLHRALMVIHNVVKKNANSKILFVGTKKQASALVKEYATRCGQYYVNYRWLGGMLTNWNTVSKSIKKLDEIEKIMLASSASEEEAAKHSKKELLDMQRKSAKLENALGGIRTMKGRPDLVIVIDTNMEDIAILEAKKLGVPVIGIVDTNSNPDSVDYPIPGNDDSSKAIEFYCRLFSEAVLSGIEESLISSGVDTKGFLPHAGKGAKGKKVEHVQESEILEESAADSVVESEEQSK